MGAAVFFQHRCAVYDDSVKLHIFLAMSFVFLYFSELHDVLVTSTMVSPYSLVYIRKVVQMLAFLFAYDAMLFTFDGS